MKHRIINDVLFINQDFCFNLPRDQSANPFNLTPKLFIN